MLRTRKKIKSGNCTGSLALLDIRITWRAVEPRFLDPAPRGSDFVGLGWDPRISISNWGLH